MRLTSERVEVGVQFGEPGDRRPVENRAPGDDHPRVDEGPEPVEWVRVEHNQVGSLAGLDRTRDVLVSSSVISGRPA
jgi:hypothetical protein